MKRLWISGSKLAVLAIVATALLWGPGAGLPRRTATRPEGSAQSRLLAQQLGAEGQASLRAIVQAGNLADLRWPDFRDYQKHVEKFYESYGYSLPWVRGMEPSAPAQQVIAVLLQAEQKGLSAEDYDGPRWSDRLAKLNPP